jgi:FMN-dependent NADH-azoreductase
MKILQIDSSARKMDNNIKAYNSISKTLSEFFIDKWLTFNNEDEVIYRDLGTNPPEFINQDWITSVFTPDDKKTTKQKSILTLSDRLIDEVSQAEIIVISSPMYNYGMPAVLKAWFDQVIRINKTFSFDLARGDFPLKPIMSGKKLILITSSGEFGFEIGGIREKMNHLGPHIEMLGKYLGVVDFYEIKSEYQEFGDERHKNSLNEAYASIEKVVKKLSQSCNNK